MKRRKNIKVVMSFLLAVLLLSSVLLPSNFVMAGIQTTYYVSPSGSDTAGNGTLSSPWQTIQKARDVVRTVNSNMTGDIYVYLMDGMYNLASTITFGNSDSGTNGYNVIYKAYTGAKPVISGGVDLSGGWTLHDSSKNIFKKTGVNGSFRQLYVNSDWAIRARIPNRTDNFTDAGYYAAVNSTMPFVVNSSEIGSWANNGVCEMSLLSHWTNIRARIENYSINGSTATVYFKSPENGTVINHHTQVPSYYYFENAYELLDAEGEWFLDTATQTLYYKPRSGENMSMVQVIAPNVDKLISIEGTSPSSQAHNIQFYGITFKYSNWTVPNSLGYLGGQGGHIHQTVPGDVENTGLWTPTSGMLCIKNANNIRVERNIFTLGGSYGIMEFEGSDHDTYVGNIFTKLASGGINIGNTTTARLIRQMPTGTGTYDLISNNLIDDVGCYYVDADGIMALKAKYVTIEHNEIRNLRHTGISMGYEWDDTGNQDSHDNNIRYNRVHQLAKLLDDAAGIYTLGKQTNTSIDHNYLYDLIRSEYSGGYPIAAIYLDNGSCYKTVEYNVGENTVEFSYALNPPNHDNIGRNNYYKGSIGSIYGYSTWTNNTDCTGSSWPQAAVDIINGSGLQSSYSDIDSGSAPVLAAKWGFNNSANDDSGNGHNVTLYGSPSYNTSDKKEGSAALSLNGSTQHASASTVTTATDNVTMSAWVKWNGGTGVQFVLYNGSTGSNGYGMYLENGVAKAFCGGLGYMVSSTSLTMGQWAHLTLVRRSGTWELYVNGNPVSITNSGMVPNTPNGSTDIGSDNVGGNCFNGLIDDVRVYNKALSTSEILALAGSAVSTPTNFFNQAYTGSRNDFTGLVGYEFTPSENINVTALGRCISGSMANNHTIKIWKVSDQSVTASVTVTPSSPTDDKGYKYEMLGSGVTLNSGIVYRITSSETNGGDAWMDFGSISNHSSIASVTGWCWSGSDTYPTNYSNEADTAFCAPAFYKDGSGGTSTDYIAKWGFNNSANDDSGNGHNATLYGSPSYNTSDKKEGSAALSLNGSTQHASASTVTTATDNVTLSAWVKWNGGTGVQFILFNGSTGTNGYGMYLENGVAKAFCGGLGYMVSSTSLTTGQWTHLTLVRRSGTWELYVNGNPVSITNSGMVPNTPNGSTDIGSDNVGGNCFNGLMDDVRVYNKALSTSEISALIQ